MKDDLLGDLRALERKHQALSRRIWRLEELFDAFGEDLRQLRAKLERILGNTAHGAGNGARTMPAEFLRSLAKAGVAKLEWSTLSGAGDLCRIDGRWFKLPKSLAALLKVLAEDRAPAGDGLLGWKTFDEVRKALAAAGGKPLSQHALHQRIYLLRRRLADSGVNPWLVQCERDQGLRFALRTGGALR